MKLVYLLDSNVVVRFLVKDHAEHFARAKELFARAEEGACELVLAPWIIAEVLYTLTSFYGADRRQSARALAALVASGGIRALDSDIVLDALERFEEKNVDFADAMLAAQAVAMGIQPASFDADLDKFPDIKRFQP
jgi:predicted nucleic acid-binding protein